MKRTVLVGFVLGLMLAVAACGGQGAAEETELNIYNWSTYIAPEMVPNFEEQFGVKVNYDLYGDNEELLAKIQPGNPGYDIIVPSDYMVAIMVEEGLLQPIDLDQIPNFANVDEKFVNPPYDPGNVYCVPYQWGTMGLGYNINATGGEIDSWEVMFNGDYAGRISWLTEPRAVLGATLQYLGYSYNSTNPDEIQEALDLLLASKPDVVAFAPDTGQILLDQGEVDVAFEWSGDIFQIMEENPDIRYAIPKEGSNLWVDNMCIPAGAPHPGLAHKFINYVLDAEVGAQLSNYTAYGTPNAASMPLIDEELRNNPGIYPPPEVMARLEFTEVLGEDELLYSEAWTSLGVGQ